MALTVDYANLLVISTASITDMVAFHLALRDFEDNPDGMLSPVIHTYKAVDLGGGATFPAVSFINGWQLKFPTPGNYVIKGGNLNATIVPVAGVFVQQTQSAAYAVTSVGGSGSSFTVTDVADAVWSHTTGAAVATRLAEAWGRLGLDASKPLISGATQISFGTLVMALTESGGNVTVTRQ